MTTRDVDVLTALDAAIPREVRTICRVLQEAGHRGWIVGGCVRDIMASVRSQSKTPFQVGDWDLCTDAEPVKVKRLFRKVIPTGIDHGTVTVVLARQHFEVTTLRGETTYTDGRHPDEVFFVEDLKEDLARRDFTVNAMAYDVMAGSLHDPFDGQGDLAAGLLRAVGEPSRRFEEDGLRVMRGARFSATLGLELEPETRAAMAPSLASFEKVARERVRDEWFKALKSKAPSRCFAILRDEGMLAITAPGLFVSKAEAPAEALATARSDQPAHSNQSARFVLTLHAIDAAAADPIRRLALLCVGGTTALAKARALAADLKLSNAERARLVLLFEHASIPNPSAPADVRRWLFAVGRQQVNDVLDFQCEARELTGSEVTPHALDAFQASAKREVASGAPLHPKELALGGRDLMQEAGITPGPQLGRLLETLFEKALAEPSLNTREQLLALAKELSDVG